MSQRTILTLCNGRGIDLLNPSAADIDFSVMAEHLAKEKRYNGATPGVEYSVAQHLVIAADASLDATKDETLAAYVLLHDGHEHTLKDDTTPKKQAHAEIAEVKFGVLAEAIIGAYDDLTDRHDRAIHEAAGLPWPPPQKYVAAIKRWDLILFVTEWRDFMSGFEHPNWEPYRGFEPLEKRLTAWSWVMAKSLFINRCHRLLPALRHREPILKSVTSREVT